MTHLIDQGKAFYWGTSEWSAQQITEACGVPRQYHLIPPQVEQPQYNMFHRKRVEREYAHLYSEIGLGTTIWSPLASGMLTGKYSEGIPGNTRVTLKGYEWLHESFQSDEGRARVEKTRRISKVAGELGCTTAQLALAWCLKNPDVSSVITGASRASQVEENMTALEVVEQLDDEVMARLEEILDNKPEPQPSFR
jgi:aryl-alcohol dehydrogenase-like predicted oxidoreductase